MLTAQYNESPGSRQTRGTELLLHYLVGCVASIYRSQTRHKITNLLSPTKFSLDIVKHGPEVFSDSIKQTSGGWKGC